MVQPMAQSTQKDAEIAELRVQLAQTQEQLTKLQKATHDLSACLHVLCCVSVLQPAFSSHPAAVGTGLTLDNFTSPWPFSLEDCRDLATTSGSDETAKCWCSCSTKGKRG